MADDGGNNQGLALEISGLRGEMSTSFAKIEGQLGLLVASDVRRERDLAQLDARVTALEARRVPWALVAGLSGAVSAVGAAVSFLAQ
jgi:hypothetical protein